MSQGDGTDILNIQKIAPSGADRSDPFGRKTYTEKELELIDSRPLPLYCFATRFAGKEAVFKAFGVHGDAFRLKDIEILEDESGVPQVFLHGKAAALAEEMGLTRIMISLSYDTDYAAAFACICAE